MHGDAPAGEAGLMPLLGLAHHPHRHRLRGHGYFKRLGPGIVTGAADDDPSGIATYSQGHCCIRGDCVLAARLLV
jgi:hypothetical protein